VPILARIASSASHRTPRPRSTTCPRWSRSSTTWPSAIGIVGYRLRETELVAGDAVRFAAADSAGARWPTPLLAVLRDPVLAARLASAGAARVDAVGLDWHRSAAGLTAAYRRLIGRELTLAPRPSRASSSIPPTKEREIHPGDPDREQVVDHALGEEAGEGQRRGRRQGPGEARGCGHERPVGEGTAGRR